MEVIPESLQSIADGLSQATDVFDRIQRLLQENSTDEEALRLLTQIDRVQFLTSLLRQQTVLASAMAQEFVDQ